MKSPPGWFATYSMKCFYYSTLVTTTRLKKVKTGAISIMHPVRQGCFTLGWWWQGSTILKQNCCTFKILVLCWQVQQILAGVPTWIWSDGMCYELLVNNHLFTCSEQKSTSYFPAICRYYIISGFDMKHLHSNKNGDHYLKQPLNLGCGDSRPGVSRGRGVNYCTTVWNLVVKYHHL